MLRRRASATRAGCEVNRLADSQRARDVNTLALAELLDDIRYKMTAVQLDVALDILGDAAADICDETIATAVERRMDALEQLRDELTSYARRDGAR